MGKSFGLTVEGTDTVLWVKILLHRKFHIRRVFDPSLHCLDKIRDMAGRAYFLQPTGDLEGRLHSLALQYPEWGNGDVGKGRIRALYQSHARHRLSAGRDTHCNHKGT